MANSLRVQSSSSSPIFVLPPIPSSSSSVLKISRIASGQTVSSSRRRNLQKTFLGLPTSLPFLALPSSAAEVPPAMEGKIDVEAIVVAIDDFFNRNPFFVSGVVFIWLVVIPLVEDQLKKCKPISAIDAFGKLRDNPSCNLLDIRKRNSLRYLRSPNLKLLNKATVHVEFQEGQESQEAFMKEVARNFPDPANTVLCILDNFDEHSLKVAEMLHEKGFKEAYAIKGGLRGKNGWQAIQETLLPPSVHVYPRKNSKASIDDEKKMNKNDGLNDQPLGTGRELKEKAGDLH